MRNPFPLFNVGILDDQNYSRKSSFLSLLANVFNIERGAGDEYQKIQKSEILGFSQKIGVSDWTPKIVHHNHDFILFVHITYHEKVHFPPWINVLGVTRLQNSLENDLKIRVFQSAGIVSWRSDFFFWNFLKSFLKNTTFPQKYFSMKFFILFLVFEKDDIFQIRNDGIHGFRTDSTFAISNFPKESTDSTGSTCYTLKS